MRRDAELYDPQSGRWRPTGSLTATRAGHTATLLADGSVLVVGSTERTAATTAEVYDPVAGTWRAVGSMSDGRFDHTMTLLPNGNVLVVGGRCDSKSIPFAE